MSNEGRMRTVRMGSPPHAHCRMVLCLLLVRTQTLAPHTPTRALQHGHVSCTARTCNLHTARHR